MALDLFFGKTRRNWSRRSDLAIAPSLPVVSQTQSNLTDALDRTVALKQGFTASPRGKGAVVKKTWKWG
jgi:hypothetical protein